MSEKVYPSFEAAGIDTAGKTGRFKTRCPQCHADRRNKADKPLSVDVQQALWNCHNCGWSGCVKKDGFNRPKFALQSMKVYEPIPTIGQTPEDRVYGYFQTRGISREIVDRNGITAEPRSVQHKGQWVQSFWICFNYFENGILYNCKKRGAAKEFTQVAGAKKILYGLDDLKGQTECIITEGEFDKLAFEVAGFKNAVSVPDGGINPNVQNTDTKMSYLETCEPWLESIDKFYLATDADAPGQRLRDELARRLGRERCWFVDFPEGCKDANEVLLKHGKEALKNCIETAKEFPIEGVFGAADYVSEVVDTYRHGYPKGATTGHPFIDNLISFFPGLMTTVTGIPSHGKSEVVDFIMARLALLHGWRFAIYSPENYPPNVHIHKLLEKIIGRPFLPGQVDQMTETQLMRGIDFINEHFFFIQASDSNTDITYLLDKVRQLVLRKGVNAYCFDPWNTIDHQYKGSETQYISETLAKMDSFNRHYSVHQFLIAHPRKMSKQKDSQKHEIPTLYDIAGSAHFYNKTHNGITIYRNFPDENGQNASTELHIQKVKYRWHGKTGMQQLQFNNTNGRFHGGLQTADYDDWLKPKETVQQLPMSTQTIKFNPADSIAYEWDAADDFEPPF